IPRHPLLELRAPAIDLPSCKIAISIVDRFELAAVDRDARLRQQTHLATEIDEARANLADRRAIVLAEIGNHLVIGNQPSEQPHDFQVSAGLALKPAASLHPVEIPVNIKLQKNRGVVGRPTCRCRLDAFEAKIGQIERVDKAINHTNGIALLDPLIEAFRQQRRLSTIGTFNKALHELLPQIAKRIIAERPFSRSQGQKLTFRECLPLAQSRLRWPRLLPIPDIAVNMRFRFRCRLGNSDRIWKSRGGPARLRNSRNHAGSPASWRDHFPSHLPGAESRVIGGLHRNCEWPGSRSSDSSFTVP